jgi:hypothetical protein
MSCNRTGEVVTGLKMVVTCVYHVCSKQAQHVSIDTHELHTVSHPQECLRQAFRIVFCSRSRTSLWTFSDAKDHKLLANSWQVEGSESNIRFVDDRTRDFQAKCIHAGRVCALIACFHGIFMLGTKCAYVCTCVYISMIKHHRIIDINQNMLEMLVQIWRIWLYACFFLCFSPHGFSKNLP